MLYVVGDDGKILNRSSSLAGIRRYASDHILDVEHIELHRHGSSAGELVVRFKNATFRSNFGSYDVMKDWVRDWRTVAGIPIYEVANGRRTPFSPTKRPTATQPGAGTPIDLRDQVLGSREEGGQLSRVFAWLTKNGMGMHFPGTPIGWYQQHQFKAIEAIQKRARSLGLPVDAMRVQQGTVQSRDGAGRWHDVMSTRAVYDAASKS